MTGGGVLILEGGDCPGIRSRRSGCPGSRPSGASRRRSPGREALDVPVRRAVRAQEPFRRSRPCPCGGFREIVDSGASQEVSAAAPGCWKPADPVARSPGGVPRDATCSSCGWPRERLPRSGEPRGGVRWEAREVGKAGWESWAEGAVFVRSSRGLRGWKFLPDLIFHILRSPRSFFRNFCPSEF